MVKRKQRDSEKARTSKRSRVPGGSAAVAPLQSSSEVPQDVPVQWIRDVVHHHRGLLHVDDLDISCKAGKQFCLKLHSHILQTLLNLQFNSSSSSSSASSSSAESSDVAVKLTFWQSHSQREIFFSFFGKHLREHMSAVVFLRDTSLRRNLIRLFCQASLLHCRSPHTPSSPVQRDLEDLLLKEVSNVTSILLARTGTAPGGRRLSKVLPAFIAENLLVNGDDYSVHNDVLCADVRWLAVLQAHPHICEQWVATLRQTLTSHAKKLKKRVFESRATWQQRHDKYVRQAVVSAFTAVASEAAKLTTCLPDPEPWSDGSGGQIFVSYPSDDDDVTHTPPAASSSGTATMTPQSALTFSRPSERQQDFVLECYKQFDQTFQAAILIKNGAVRRPTTSTEDTTQSAKNALVLTDRRAAAMAILGWVFLTSWNNRKSEDSRDKLLEALGSADTNHLTRNNEIRKATFLLAQRFAWQLDHMATGKDAETFAKMVVTRAVNGLVDDKDKVVYEEKEATSWLNSTWNYIRYRKWTHTSATPDRVRKRRRSLHEALVYGAIYGSSKGDCETDAISMHLPTGSSSMAQRLVEVDVTRLFTHTRLRCRTTEYTCNAIEQSVDSGALPDLGAVQQLDYCKAQEEAESRGLDIERPVTLGCGTPTLLPGQAQLLLLKD